MHFSRFGGGRHLYVPLKSEDWVLLAAHHLERAKTFLKRYSFGCGDDGEDVNKGNGKEEAAAKGGILLKRQANQSKWKLSWGKRVAEWEALWCDQPWRVTDRPNGKWVLVGKWLQWGDSRCIISDSRLARRKRQQMQRVLAAADAVGGVEAFPQPRLWLFMCRYHLSRPNGRRCSPVAGGLAALGAHWQHRQVTMTIARRLHWAHHQMITLPGDRGLTSPVPLLIVILSIMRTAISRVMALRRGLLSDIPL